MKKEIVEKDITCPYCREKVKVNTYSKKSSKEVAHCTRCGKLFRVYVNYGEHMNPLCDQGCNKGFVYIDTRNFVFADGNMKHEVRKVTKTGRLLSKVMEYRDSAFCEDEYIECVGCKARWNACFDEKGKII